MTLLKMTDLDLSDKQLLIRVDLNVPLENKKVTSIKRIEAILPTLHIALDQGARIILMSHLGRPKEGEYDPNLSLAPVAECLSELLGQPVRFLKELPDTLHVKPKEIVLLENIRFLKGEKENSIELGKKLAKLCDIFVMDAFATAHRKEASTYSVAKEAKVACAGPLLLAEINAIAQVMAKPSRPLVAIVAGSKVSTKLSILKNILSMVDCLIVGGGIANTFLAAEGYDIGKSLFEPELIQEAKEMMLYAKAHGKNILLPEDVVVANEFSSEVIASTISVSQISKENMILDIGPRTIQKLTAIIDHAKTILWNGPVGVFEWDQFSAGTEALAKAIGKGHAYSIAGGGDTIAAIEKYGLERDISYISTGGGAFLECLEGKQLPAIAVLEQKKVGYATY